MVSHHSVPPFGGPPLPGSSGFTLAAPATWNRRRVRAILTPSRAAASSIRPIRPLLRAPSLPLLLLCGYVVASFGFLDTTVWLSCPLPPLPFTHSPSRAAVLSHPFFLFFYELDVRRSWPPLACRSSACKLILPSFLNCLLGTSDSDVYWDWRILFLFFVPACHVFWAVKSKIPRSLGRISPLKPRACFKREGI